MKKEYNFISDIYSQDNGRDFYDDRNDYPEAEHEPYQNNLSEQ